MTISDDGPHVERCRLRIVAISDKTLRAGRAPPTRPESRTVALTNASNPSRTINVAGNTRPAFATRLSSSNVTPRRSIERDADLTESASWRSGPDDFEHRHRPCSGGTFRGYAALLSPDTSVDQGLA